MKGLIKKEVEQPQEHRQIKAEMLKSFVILVPSCWDTVPYWCQKFVIYSEKISLLRGKATKMSEGLEKCIFQ